MKIDVMVKEFTIQIILGRLRVSLRKNSKNIFFFNCRNFVYLIVIKKINLFQSTAFL